MRDRPNPSEGILLENREVVAIVVGSLVVLGIVFYLGVSVGKGLSDEPRAPEQKPLEVLDRQAEVQEKEAWIFPHALVEEEGEPGTEASEAKVEAAPRDEEPAKADPTGQEGEEAAKAEVSRAEEPTGEKEQADSAKAPQQETQLEVAKADAAKAAEAPKVEMGQGKEETFFTVQLASFPHRKEAESFAETLRKAGMAPRVVEADIPERGTYFRVRVGRFSSQEEAAAYLRDLQREGRFQGIVMQVEG